MFSDAKVNSVFEDYEARAQSEREQIDLEGFGAGNRDDYLLPIGADVGRFLHSLILAKKPKRIMEIGTGYGYSTLFLADAARIIGAEVVTLELAHSKQAYAQEKLSQAGLSVHVVFRVGDAVDLINADPDPTDFALLDIWKSLYAPCLEALYPKLSEEGMIAADNMYYPEDTLEKTRQYRQAVLSKPDLQTTLLPIGSGIELTCRWPKGSAKL